MHGFETEAVLDRAHDALLRGDLAALGPIAAQLDTVADLHDVDAAMASRIRRKAERNALLLQAAARGVRVARGRLAEITAEPALRTYTASGQRESFGQVSGQPSKRI